MDEVDRIVHRVTVIAVVWFCKGTISNVILLFKVISRDVTSDFVIANIHCPICVE